MCHLIKIMTIFCLRLTYERGIYVAVKAVKNDEKKTSIPLTEYYKKLHLLKRNSNYNYSAKMLN